MVKTTYPKQWTPDGKQKKGFNYTIIIVTPIPYVFSVIN
jgi:hypothetical protein